MLELNEDSNFDSYHDNYDKSQEQEIGQEGGSMEENGFKIRNPEELKKSFYELKMDENDLYEMVINNDIALNLYQSLFKLKRGSDRRLFKYPCQIKVYPKVKIMVIYIIISHNFLRIKTELLFLRENPKYKKPDQKELKSKINSKSSVQSQESQSINSNKISEEIDNESNKENEIIFTIELNDFFNMLGLLLCDNKDNPISISIDNNLSQMTGKEISPDTFNQFMDAVSYQYNLIKNEVFEYKINPPKEQSKKIEKKSNLNEIENEENKKSNDSKNSESSNININNIQSKSLSQINQLNDSEPDYLEKKFTTDEKGARYIIEGSDLVELFHLMKGLESNYNGDFSTHSLGISMTNEKALFFDLNYENIKDTKSLVHFSRNIKSMTTLNIKSVKNHFLTPFKYGFNSFYRSALLSAFIISFYNKDDRRLLVKVSPSGKMILAYTFSDPKVDNEMNRMINEVDNEAMGISTEIYDNLNENENNQNLNNNDSNGRNRIGRKLIDRLLDDENRGNIVEMIFYPSVFDLCKS